VHTGAIAEMTAGLSGDSANAEMTVKLGQLWQVSSSY
jgi:hypothetical protein